MIENLHTFVLCAYKENKYLENCLLSLLNQTVKSVVLISTSTPNEFIEDVSKKYNVPLFVNEGNKGIANDWNFAYSLAKTTYVTLAHQDDFYEPNYTENILNKHAEYKNPIILFSDYFEIRQDKRVFSNRILKIKRMMNFPLKIFPCFVFIRIKILSIGDSISCPTVTFNKSICGENVFDNNYKMVCDWEAWLRLAQKKGSFVYISKPLMGHRIYEGSTTTALIENGERYKEELSIFEKYRSGFMSKILMKLYVKAHYSNNLN